MLVLYNCIHYMHIKKVYNVGEKKYRGKYVRLYDVTSPPSQLYGRRLGFL